jgi:hypothetical protein
VSSGTIEYSLAEWQRASVLLESYLAEVERDTAERHGRHDFSWLGRCEPTDFAAGTSILDGVPQLQIAIIMVWLDRALSRSTGDERLPFLYRRPCVSKLLSRLYRRKLPFSDANVIWILRRLSSSGADWYRIWSNDINVRGLVRALQRGLGGRQLPVHAHEALRQLRRNIADAGSDSFGRATLAAIDEALGDIVEPASMIDPIDDWGFAAAADLKAMSAAERASWLRLLECAGSARGAKPSRTWLKQAREQIDACKTDQFAATAMRWLRLLNAPSRNAIYVRADRYSYPSAYIADRNADILKGLAWCCSLSRNDELTRAVADAAIACYRKLPDIGARSLKAGNACVWSLGAMASLAAAAELQRLRQRVKQPSALKQIDGALAAAAGQLGLTRDDLDDLGVPAFGLEQGRSSAELGPYTAEIAITASDAAELRWRRPDGRLQASVPAEVRCDLPEELKALKQTLRDIRAALPAQRARIERLLLAERSWRVPEWRARYLDHALLAPISRRLIWQFEHDDCVTYGAWLDGAIVDVDDRPHDALDESTRVRLWHPIGSEPRTVLAWREWLERHEVTQPFKQAHREVYLLTDAELQTLTYSNRFAAHILRQHQLQALCQGRGWRYHVQGSWDGFNTPALDLPLWDLRAEYWVEGAGDEDALFAASGVYLYVATDQVRFARLSSGAALPLTEVPAVVFSEVMRDVDLFVGVASVGNDPTWADRGPEGHRAYWEQYSFGDLSASAHTRRVVLERLLPRLTTLAGRWSLDERFLVVRGDLRTYRIHLGSGNILMEPNNQYLCIVPSRGADPLRGGTFLPFEGDGMLSIILSKALLLAADRAISDPTITRQIGAP